MFGLGGVGKSQIALDFAYLMKDKHPNCAILWVPAVSLATFEQEMANIARLLKIPITQDERTNMGQAVKDYLSQDIVGQWLYILDNADSKDLLFGSDAAQESALTSYLPQSAMGSIVFTTRSEEIAIALARSDRVEVPEMTEAAARELLEKSLNDKRLLQDFEAVSSLLDELTYLPLAITQASAYIQKTKRLSRDT